MMSSALRWFSHHSLKSQLSFLVLAVTGVSMAVVGAFSYQRSHDQTVTETRAWAESLALLAAHASAVPLRENDRATLDGALQEIIALPGVHQIQVLRPGGEVAMQVQRRPEGTVITISPRQGERVAPPSGPSFLHDEHVHAFASLLGANRAAKDRRVDYSRFAHEGWVEVELSFANKLQATRLNWFAATAGTLALVLLALVLFHLFLRRALRPIHELARFSASMAQAPGETLKMRWGSQEVRELGRALNWASTELARRMAASQQKLARLRAILDTAADAIIGVGADGNIASTNPAAERMFGRSAEELRGRPLSEYLVGMDAQTLRQTMADGMLIHSTQSRIGRVEMNALRHGGTECPVEVLLGEISGDQEVRYTCIVRDLTDMKQAEDYLTLYGRVVDCTPIGIAISDARRYPQPIVHVNPAFTRITGYEAHELLGRDGGILEGELTDPDDLALLARTVQTGGELKMTLRNYRKDRSLFHNKLSVAPVRDSSDNITHYINIVEDVSGQIEVKQKLIERTARLNATFDLSPDGFVVFDAQGELITSNPAFRAMVGEVPSWASLHRFDVWFKNLCDDFDSYRAITEAWNDRSKDTMVLSRPTRKVLEREIRRNHGGSGETFLYFRDVTHQFEVDRIKSEFLATAAHELRTPLASILGFTELMIHRKYSEDKQKDLLQTVHRQGTLLSNLIQELLDLSRIEARQGKDFHIQPTPLAEIVRETVQTLLGHEQEHDLDMDPIPDLMVMADASKIQQALSNLLSNAFKYSPQGGPVRVAFEQSEHDGEHQIVIHVRDQGIGMTPSQLARAFERFYRADSSGSIPGTGLGLNLVKEIAEIHGGSVELSSEPGVGTVASLHLKRASVALAEEAH
jgi:PAS domain S-box-containing protein